MKAAATTSRNFRTFLLMSQLAKKDIGGRIALARNEKGLTQEQLSDLSSFSVRALQTWEAGQVVPYRQMQEISRLLARPVDWFLHGEQPASEESSVELRLEELAEAVNALRAQFGEAVSASLLRLEAIERRLPPPTASDLPTGAGTPAAGGRR